jgi:hypothetical protein
MRNCSVIQTINLFSLTTGVGTGIGDTPELNKGLVFLRELELVVTGVCWDLMINARVACYSRTYMYEG